MHERATNIHLLTKQITDILLYNLHLRYQYSSWFISCHSNLGSLPKLCIAVYIFKSHLKRAVVIWTHNYIPVKPTLVTSKCVTKSAQIFDGKTSKSDAIVLKLKFLNKFCPYNAILPVDGATNTGGRISMRPAATG